MAEPATLARPYARAAFSYAEEHEALEQWETALTLAAQTAQHPSVAERLSSPALSAEARAELLAKLCGRKLPQAPKRFVQLLAEKNRLPLLGAVAAMFSALKTQREKSVRVDIYSARALSKTLCDRLTQALRKTLDCSVQVQTHADEELIGGVLIRAGDVVIDGSVRGRLERLAEAVRA